MKLKNIMNEIRKGDFVDSMGEIGLVNKVKGRVAYVSFLTRPGTFHPKSVSSLTKTGKKHRGKDLYTESIINEASAKYKAFKSKFIATPPRWATAVAQEKNGKWFYYENEPKVTSSGMKSTGKKEDTGVQTAPKTWNQGPHSFFVANGRVTEGKLNESQKITDNDIEKMADIAKKNKMKLAKMATHKAVSGNWTYQKMYDELMDDHDGQSYVSNSDRKKFYKAVKKAFPKAKIKEGINEGLNKADVKYAMKMAFDNIPGNWHKALKKVEVLSGGPKGGRIKLNMSSYMGPNKTLQAIVDEFNDIMGMKGYMTGPKPFKINKSSFVKGSITSIILESNDLVFNHGKFGGTGKPWPQTEPNEFAYIDFKKWAKSKEKKIKKQMSILKDDRIFRAMEFVWQTWDKQANKGAFSNIKGNQFGRALVKMMWEDNLVFDKKNHKIITIKESSKLSKIIEGSKIWQQLDKVWKLRDEAMDVETNIIERTKELKQLYMDMEQEAEPGGGPIADKYGKQIEKLEKILKKDRAILKMYMKKIDKLESY